MIFRILITFFFFVVSIPSVFSNEILDIAHSLINKYERTITILYISENPKLLDVKTDDVVVYWTQNDGFVKRIKERYTHNAVILTKKYNKALANKLSECEHFDICIMDCPPFFQALNENFHLADFTIMPKSKKPIYKKKDILKKNVWNGISKHNNYSIHSDFKTKYFIKPKQYIVNGKSDKVYYWIPGINLCTFIQLEGIYPNQQHLRTSIIELLNPYTHFDFSWGNIIIQGLSLRAIDFDDTHYSQDPNSRLKMTLEKQLNMKYD